MSAEDEGQEAAEEFRRTHRLGSQPLGDLVTLVEQETDVDVAVLDVDPDEHGLTMKDPERGTIFIAIARTPHPMRQRSTLAHELGHVIFSDWTEKVVTSRSHEEVRADAFARHLLLPAGGLAAWLGEPSEVRSGPQDLSDLVERFLVSPAIAAIQLERGGYISASTKEEWMRLTTRRLATQHGWSDHYAALQSESDRTRAPRQLLARATRGYSEGVVPIETLASLRGVPVERLLEELDEAGVHPSVSANPWASAHDLPSVDVDLSDLDEQVGDEEQP